MHNRCSLETDSKRNVFQQAFFGGLCDVDIEFTSLSPISLRPHKGWLALQKDAPTT